MFGPEEPKQTANELITPLRGERDSFRRQSQIPAER